MGRRTGRVREVLRALYAGARAENVTFIAASIAYHAFVSLLPLLVLVLLVLRQVGGESLSALLLSIIEGAFTPTGRDLIIETVEGGPRLSGMSAFGLAVLTWATLRIFREIDQAFSAVYDADTANTLADQILDGFVVFGAVVVAVVGAGLLRTTFTLGDGVVGAALRTLLVIVVLSVALYPLYFVFPDVDLHPAEALPGTVAAAVGLTGMESLFRLYVQVSSTGERYGVVGGIVLVLTWLYFNGLVLLLGAVLNAVLTNRSANVTVEPVIGDHRVGLDTPSGGEEAATVEVAGGGDGASGELSGRHTVDRPAAVGGTLGPLARRIEGGDSLTVVTDGATTELPCPSRTEVVDDTEESAELRLRW